MTVRIGLLSAARISEAAMVEPARIVAGVEVTTVAARAAATARDAAARWGIERWVEGYETLLADPGVDAVYIATPASFHRPWAVAALEAGKHVLVEKPLAANAADAARMVAAAERSDQVAMEGMHWRHHPLAARMKAIVDSGRLGRVTEIDATFEVAADRIPTTDIRYRLELGGGAMMDIGCYPLSWVRHLIGPDCTVESAEATEVAAQIDGDLSASLVWRSGVRGTVTASMIGATPSHSSIVVSGDRATLHVETPVAPQNGARLWVEEDGVQHPEDVATSATFVHQLEAFRDAIVDGAPFLTSFEEGAAVMALIDAAYQHAGLEPRPAAP